MTGGGLERLTVSMLEAAVRWMWGFTPRLIPLIVEELGTARAIIWFIRNMPRYELTLRVLGPVRAHLAAMIISLHHGCSYCAFGQAYALELLYLRDRGHLFPLDAHTVAGWTGLTTVELRDRLCGLLERAGLHQEVLWADRTLAMATGVQPPIDRAEARIAHLVRMLAVMNAIGIASQLVPEGAHDPVNKDVELKARCAELRAAAR